MSTCDTVVLAAMPVYNQAEACKGKLVRSRADVLAVAYMPRLFKEIKRLDMALRSISLIVEFALSASDDAEAMLACLRSIKKFVDAELEDT